MTDLSALALTVAIEWPLLAGLSRRGFRRTGLLCFAMNGTTWGTAMALLSLWPLPIPLLETAIILAESLILYACLPIPPGRSLLYSLILNLASWQLGSFLLSQLMEQ